MQCNTGTLVRCEGSTEPLEVAIVTTSDESLFTDWCASIESTPKKVSWQDIAAFLMDCPTTRANERARARAALRVCRRHHNRVPVPARPAQTAARTGEGWLPLDEALDRLPVWGWPVGATGRRDGFLLAVTHLTHLPRSRVATLGMQDVTWDANTGAFTIAGTTITPTPSTHGCPTCRIWWWTHTASAYDADTAGDRAAAIRSVTTSTPTCNGHVCATTPDLDWVTVLAPRIDQHGWFGDALTPRSITRILAARCATTAPILPGTDRQAPPAAAPALSTPAGPRATMDGVTDTLDSLDERIDAILAETITMTETQGLTASGKGYLRGVKRPSNSQAPES